jgi:hypothetical protein
MDELKFVYDIWSLMELSHAGVCACEYYNPHTSTLYVVENKIGKADEVEG